MEDIKKQMRNKNTVERETAIENKTIKSEISQNYKSRGNEAELFSSMNKLFNTEYIEKEDKKQDSEFEAETEKTTFSDMKRNKSPEENYEDEVYSSYEEKSDDSNVCSSNNLSVSSSEYIQNTTDVARPKVSKQIKLKYCVNRGELKIPFDVHIMIPGSKREIDSENLRLLIRDTLPSTQNIKCRMTFGTLRKNKVNYVMYSTCRNVECRQKFKLASLLNGLWKQLFLSAVRIIVMKNTV